MFLKLIDFFIGKLCGWVVVYIFIFYLLELCGCVLWVM